MANETTRRATAGVPTSPGSTAGTPSRRSCATVQNHFRLLDRYPQFRFNQAALEGFTRAARDSGGRSLRAGPVTIPVVVHVVFRTAEENISDAQIQSQIDVLNQDFIATNTDMSKVPEPFKALVGNPQIRFELAKEDPSGNSTNGITRTRTDQRSFGVDDGVKSSATGGVDPWDTKRYLNIWVCTLGDSLLGYAQFPGGPPETDGVVILNAAFGTQGTAAAPFDKGRTATHEIGHYLNLSHIWGESRIPNCTDSDFVDDTPNQFGPNTGMPSFPYRSCSNSLNGDMFMNYMDYVDDEAMFMFSQGQAVRMRATLDQERAELVSGALVG
jgi:Pregnancy-associated plasma protein-A